MPLFDRIDPKQVARGLRNRGTPLVVGAQVATRGYKTSGFGHYDRLGWAYTGEKVVGPHLLDNSVLSDSCEIEANWTNLRG